MQDGGVGGGRSGKEWSKTSTKAHRRCVGACNVTLYDRASAGNLPGGQPDRLATRVHGPTGRDAARHGTTRHGAAQIALNCRTCALAVPVPARLYDVLRVRRMFIGVMEGFVVLQHLPVRFGALGRVGRFPGHGDAWEAAGEGGDGNDDDDPTTRREREA